MNHKDLDALLGHAPVAKPVQTRSSTAPAPSVQKPTLNQTSSSISMDVARRLLQLNPDLRSIGESTAEFVVTAQEVFRKDAAPNPSNKQAGTTASKDADLVIHGVQKRYEQDKRDLETQMFLLKQKIAALDGLYLTQLMDDLYGIDPNLSSIITSSAIKKHHGFLQTLGFSAEKYIQRARDKK